MRNGTRAARSYSVIDRSSTATATFRGVRDSLEIGYANSGYLARLVHSRNTALIGSAASASVGLQPEGDQKETGRLDSKSSSNKAKHGDCNVPSKQGKLGNWVRVQRVAFKADSFSQDRIGSEALALSGHS